MADHRVGTDTRTASLGHECWPVRVYTGGTEPGYGGRVNDSRKMMARRDYLLICAPSAMQKNRILFWCFS